MTLVMQLEGFGLTQRHASKSIQRDIPSLAAVKDGYGYAEGQIGNLKSSSMLKTIKEVVNENGKM